MATLEQTLMEQTAGALQATLRLTVALTWGGWSPGREVS